MQQYTSLGIARGGGGGGGGGGYAPIYQPCNSNERGLMHQ